LKVLYTVGKNLKKKSWNAKFFYVKEKSQIFEFSRQN